MVNCGVSGICGLCAQLMLEQLARQDYFVAGRATLDDPVSDNEKQRARGWLKIAASVADDFEGKAVQDRIALFERKLNNSMSQRDLANEYKVLRETLDSGLREQFIYRYPTNKIDVIRKWKEEWGSVLEAFPSAGDDIIAGVDLWALGHSTASVFHLGIIPLTQVRCFRLMVLADQVVSPARQAMCRLGC